MDYSRSRMRLGSGPQMVKTYGRFRQRMVNRDAKIAEEFTKAAGARPNITDILDTLSSDSDFEPARPTESPLPGLEPKVEPKTKSRPKSKPRTKMQAGEKSKLLADNVSDAMAEPAIAETRKPSASGRRSRPSTTTSRNQEEAPEQPAVRANNKTTQAMDRSSTTKPEISEPKVEQTKSQVPEIQQSATSAQQLTAKPETKAQQQPALSLEINGSGKPRARAAQSKPAPKASGKPHASRTLPRRKAASRVAEEQRLPEQKDATPLDIAAPRSVPTGSVEQIRRPDGHLDEAKSSVPSTLPQSNENKAKVETISPSTSSNVTKRRATRVRRPIVAPDAPARIAAGSMVPVLESQENATISDRTPQSNPPDGSDGGAGLQDVGANRPTIRTDGTDTKDIARRISRISIAEPQQHRSFERKNTGSLTHRASVKGEGDNLPPGWMVAERSARTLTETRLDESPGSRHAVHATVEQHANRSGGEPAQTLAASDSTLSIPHGRNSSEVDGDAIEEEPEKRRLLATRTMRFKAPRNARAQTCEIEDGDEDPDTAAATGNPSRRDTAADAVLVRRGTGTGGIGVLEEDGIASDWPTNRTASSAHPTYTQHEPQETPWNNGSGSAAQQPCTPPRPNKANGLPVHSRLAMATPPNRAPVKAASSAADVPHSPSRIATPHRVVFSPMRPVTQMRPSRGEPSRVSAPVNGPGCLLQPSATPVPQSSMRRTSDQRQQDQQQKQRISLASRESAGGDRVDDTELEETKVPFLPARRYVQKAHILAACGQTAPIDWAAGGLQACGVLLPELDPAQRSEAQLGEIESEYGLCKIGEATYSEVFSAQWRYVPRTRYDKFNSKKGKVKGERLMQVALKVIPFGNSGVKSGTGEPQTTLRDLYQEIGATLALSRLSERERAKLQEARAQVKMPLKLKERELGANFVKAFRVCICQGPMPGPLLRAWDRWKAEYPDLCENTRPDYYPQNQLFAVFVLEMGGETLENAAVSTWKEARSIIRQLALSMALAERNNQFEHRDLHWGNIMVTRYNSNLTFLYQLPPMGSRSKSTLISIPSYKVRCTIIDYTLSRLHIDNDPGEATAAASKPANYDPTNNVFYVSLKDEALFQGEGDIQFDVYRQMRVCSSSEWEGFHPHTNVLWLTYALQKILATKSPKIKDELIAFVESKLGPAFDKAPPELRKAAGQELLCRWIKEFQQCESSSQILGCALLDLYKG